MGSPKSQGGCFGVVLEFKVSGDVGSEHLPTFDAESRWRKRLHVSVIQKQVRVVQIADLVKDMVMDR